MRHTLRLLTSVSLAATVFLSAYAQNTGINVTGATPNTKALLDIDVTGLPAGAKKGMLIPRMTYAQRLAISGLGVADRGLWVYQTDDPVMADPTESAAFSHGLWYYEGVNAAPYDWVRWSAGNASWKLNGNANTAFASNFLGSTTGSNDDLYIRTTNNTAIDPVIRIDGSVLPTAGFVGVNLGAPATERLEVDGGMRVGNSTLNTVGSIEYDASLASPNRWHVGNIDGTATGWRRIENAETRHLNQSYCPILDQCLNADGVKVRGTYDGSPLAGNPNTPFATNTGSNQRLGDRVQYIYPGSELLAAGLCPGLITKISFYILINDGPGCTPNVNCPDVKVDIRMGNTLQANFGAYVASQAAPLPVNWDAPTEASANINAGFNTPILLQTGWIDFTLSPAFNWTGGNLAIDVSWIRAAAIGISPTVQLEEGLAYTATKWVQVTSGFDPSHGNTYQDNPLTLNATTGNTQNRPVTRFYGKVSTPGFGAATTAAFLNYGGGLVVDTNVSPLTWADANYRGPGSIRARVAVYDGNSTLSDHVFDKYYDGDVAPEDVKGAAGYTYVGLPALKEYLQKERHLPNMPSREDWDSHGSPSLGELQTGLWESVETQALHISELENDLSVLEAMAFGKRADPAELEQMISEVNNSRRLTDEQKLHLTDAIRSRMNANKDTK